MDSDEGRDYERKTLPGDVVSGPGRGGGEELFGITPVGFIGEGRVRKIRNELLPRRMLPNGPINCRSREECSHWHESRIHVVQHEVIREFQDDVHFLVAGLEETVPGGKGWKAHGSRGRGRRGGCVRDYRRKNKEFILWAWRVVPPFLRKPCD